MYAHTCTHTHTHTHTHTYMHTYTGYAPIKFQGDAKAEISLGYSFFYDLATVDTSTGAGPQQRRRRRRRSVGGEEVLQTVEISFRPVEVRRGILLYSRTQTSIHVLKVG